MDFSKLNICSFLSSSLNCAPNVRVSDTASLFNWDKFNLHAFRISCSVALQTQLSTVALSIDLLHRKGCSSWPHPNQIYHTSPKYAFNPRKNQHTYLVYSQNFSHTLALTAQLVGKISACSSSHTFKIRFKNAYRRDTLSSWDTSSMGLNICR